MTAIRQTATALALHFDGALSAQEVYAAACVGYVAAYGSSDQRELGRLGDLTALADDVAAGDAQIARYLSAAMGRASAQGSAALLLEAVTGIDRCALEAYLLNGPVAHAAGGGDFSTPEGASRLALALLEISSRDTVADFGCGQGDFLHMAAQVQPGAQFVGMDTDADAVAVAKLRARALSANISYVQGDMFEHAAACAAASADLVPGPVSKAFSNYPWGMRPGILKSQAPYVRHLLEQLPDEVRLGSTDWIFNHALVDSLAPGGLAVAVMTKGACSNARDVAMRRYFAQKGYVKAVIALPKGLFAPYTLIETALVVLCPGGSAGIQFVDATELVEPGRRGVQIGQEDVEAIMDCMRSDFSTSVWADLADLEEHEFDFTPAAYRGGDWLVRDGVPLEEVAQMRRGASLRASELDRLQTDGAAAARYLNLAGISDCRIQDDLPRLSELEPRLEKYLLQDGDVVVSKSGSPFKVAVARPGRRGKILASGNLYIVRPNKDVLDPDFLAAFLASEVGERNLHHVCVGTSIQSLPIKGLAKIRLPKLSLEKQQKIGQAFRERVGAIAELEHDLEKKRRELRRTYGASPRLMFR